MNDAVVILGLLAVVAGIGMVSVPGAVIVGGVLLTVFGLLSHFNRGRRRGAA